MTRRRQHPQRRNLLKKVVPIGRDGELYAQIGAWKKRKFGRGGRRKRQARGDSKWYFVPLYWSFVMRSNPDSLKEQHTNGRDAAQLRERATLLTW